MSTALSSSSPSPPCHGGSSREGVWTIAWRKTSQRAMDSENVTVCKRVCPDFLTIRDLYAKQEYAAHRTEWSAKLRSRGSERTGIRSGLATCLSCAFTAHS